MNERGAFQKLALVDIAQAPEIVGPETDNLKIVLMQYNFEGGPWSAYAYRIFKYVVSIRRLR